MKDDDQTKRMASKNERGAALVMVLLATILLATACVAMLSAVGASSQNNTDALTEAKAYYAAESGLQAAIKVLRHDNVTYTQANNDPDMSTWLSYTGDRVTIDSETAFSISVIDPDNSAAATRYTTSGVFANTSVGPWTSTKYFPNDTAPDRMELSYVPPTGAPVTINHPVTSAPYPSLGSFRVTKIGLGAEITPVQFRIDYQMSAPRADTRSMWGQIVIDGSTAKVRFTSFAFTLSGGQIGLCPDSNCATDGVSFADFPLVIPGAGFIDTPTYAKIGALPPYRLKMLSTGYGPDGALKRLEAILQKNPFNNSAGGPPLQMMGPNGTFIPGPSNNMEIQGGSAPSIGVCDAATMNTINTAHTNGTMNPPPQITCNQVPTWMQSPINMDALIRSLRQAAVNTGRYYTNGGPNSSQGWGNFDTGLGLTFCEGNCSFGGNSSGGGILVVTGTLTTSGNPTFKGLVLVTGPGGIVRSGGGNELFIGNIVVAPYDPNNLTTAWTISPIYNQAGGPGGLINSSLAVDDAFNGTQAITDLMLGVAEK